MTLHTAGRPQRTNAEPKPGQGPDCRHPPGRWVLSHSRISFLGVCRHQEGCGRVSEVHAPTLTYAGLLFTFDLGRFLKLLRLTQAKSQSTAGSGDKGQREWRQPEAGTHAQGQSQD